MRLLLVLLCVSAWFIGSCAGQTAAERAAQTAADVVQDVSERGEQAELATSEACERAEQVAGPVPELREQCARARKAFADLRVAVESAKVLIAQVDAQLVTARQIADAAERAREAYATALEAQRQLEALLKR